jgi:putative restriction endonuclease
MPDFSFDDELRAMVVAHVQQLRERFGGRIPHAALSTGVMAHGRRVPIWNHQKGIFKPAALGRDGAALSVQTSAESPYADSHDPDAGDDPARLQYTLVADYAHAPVADTVMTAARREYATRAVMQRLHQQQFRRLVLTAYREQCAICRLRHIELLDAAHILPDRDPRGDPVITNGLGLCKIHHSAYDAYILGIDPDARVHVRGDILDEIDGPMLRHGLQEVHGARLILPRHVEQRPNREFLEERFERFRAA